MLERDFDASGGRAINGTLFAPFTYSPWYDVLLAATTALFIQLEANAHFDSLVPRYCHEAKTQRGDPVFCPSQ